MLHLREIPTENSYGLTGASDVEATLDVIAGKKGSGQRFEKKNACVFVASSLLKSGDRASWNDASKSPHSPSRLRPFIRGGPRTTRRWRPEMS
jgi:hypothetical protein